MTASGSRPWLLSLALHLLLAGAAAGILVQGIRPGPEAVRLRLVAPGAPSGGGKAAASADPWRPAGPAAPGVSEPSAPVWRSVPAPASPSVPNPVVPASLEELLAGTSAGAADPAAPVRADQGAGWTSPGAEGYEPPPLPPPGLTPPQGARWNLTVSVPGPGGPATAVEGLDSGHPELDAWLESYLRTVSFPASLDGRDHQLRWTLELRSGRPR